MRSTAAVDEMGVALQRSAYSSNIKTRGDFSCMFFDRRLRAVAQAFTQPIHLGGLFHLVPTVIRSYGAEKLGPGDGLLVNHPFLGGVHLNDVTLISPVFVGGELFGYPRQPGPPRRRRRRRTGQHRGVPRGLPGGDHHPAGEAGRSEA